MNNALRHILAGACLALGLTLLSAARAGAAEQVGQGYPGRAPAVSAAPSAAVQTPTAPASVPAEGTENRTLAFSDSSSRRPPRAMENRSGGSYAPSILPALFYAAVVCAVFFGILYLAKKYLPGHRQLFAHPAMEVLGRTHIDQRRYVSLLRVGKRIIVVGVSPDEMRSLSEITDEEEITGILEVARPKSEMGLTLFQRLFKRHVIDAENDTARAEAAEKAKAIEEQMSLLRRRVRTIREREEPVSRHVDATG